MGVVVELPQHFVALEGCTYGVVLLWGHVPAMLRCYGDTVLIILSVMRKRMPSHIIRLF